MAGIVAGLVFCVRCFAVRKHAERRFYYRARVAWREKFSRFPIYSLALPDYPLPIAGFKQTARKVYAEYLLSFAVYRRAMWAIAEALSTCLIASVRKGFNVSIQYYRQVWSASALCRS